MLIPWHYGEFKFSERLDVVKIVIAVLAPLMLGGCVAQLAADVITAPIKIVSKTADILTTSQSESDQNRGKKLRERDEEVGKLSRKRDKFASKCDKGDQDACGRVEALDTEISEVGSRKI
jgi:large-conductance mechanosensitive channel